MSEFTYEYLPWRGVTKETMAVYDVKTKIDAEGKPVSIGFPYTNDALKVRKFDVPKDEAFYSVGAIGEQGLFGKNRFTPGVHKYVTITEGELDALSLHQILHAPVVSVQSSVTGVRDCTIDRAWLNTFERIYLAFDADEQGRRCCREVAKLFDFNKLYVVRFDRRKDANEYLQNDEGEALRKLWWNSKKYQPERVVSSLEDFREILKEPPKWGLPYPFPTLTQMTYGIRPEEVVLITAQEGIGKTELMHAIEHRILTEIKHGQLNAAVGAIYLEEPKKRHLQAIAGVEIQKPVHLPDAGCSPAEAFDAISNLVEKDDRLNLYSHYGADDPDILLDTIRFMVSGRNCRYVLLDHLSMAVTGLAGEDERLALDYLSTRLSMMVQELGFALIVVSHVNDDGKTRGSRYISKVAHVRIDIDRDVKNNDPVVSILVAKNRDIGKTGPAGRYAFDQYTRRYTEIEGADDNDPETTQRRAA